MRLFGRVEEGAGVLAASASTSAVVEDREAVLAVVLAARLRHLQHTARRIK